MMPSLAAADEDALSVALRYAAAGLRVLPIKPGTKRPPMGEWVQAATNDTSILTNWFTGIYKDHGVGLALGHQPNGQFIFALDVDEHSPEASGSETLADLEAEHGSLPDSWRSITGAGGLHLLFSCDVEVRNGVAGSGLDVRGEGGQIVVYPSYHPTTGARYEWEHTFAPWDRSLAEAPDWLMKLVRRPPATTTPAPAPTQTFSLQQPESPAEWLRAQWDWSYQLADAGWSEHHADPKTGDVYWTRPGKAVRDGESAVMHPGGPFVIWSTDASLSGLRAAGRPTLDGGVSLSAFEFYAALRHAGDLSAAGRAIRQMMNPAPDSRLSAPAASGSPDQFASVDQFDGYLAQVTDWHDLMSGDHAAGENWAAEPLIPAERLTVFYAPAKQGKSEVALAVVIALATGRPILGQRNDEGPADVVYLDYEMTKSDLLERLELLGYSDPAELSHLHYYSLPSLPPLDTAKGADVLRRIAAHHKAKVVVIDTMGRAVEGDENSSDTYRAFARTTGLALKSDGVAVLRTDHAGKDKEKGQRGSSAKNDDADVIFRVDKTDSGWKLTRTHTRIGWAPESVVIDRTVMPDLTLKIELARSTTKVVYPVGTTELAKELRAAGITVTRKTTEAQITKDAQSAGVSRQAKMMRAALKWMKAELPDFTDGPTPVEPSADRRLADDPDGPPRRVSKADVL